MMDDARLHLPHRGCAQIESRRWRPRWPRRAIALLFAGLICLATHQTARAGRLALVIGNAAYTAGPLANPVKDANAVSAALRSLGFDVTTVRNLRRDEIGRTLEAFASRIRPGDDIVFFYAGHGVQIKGTNYLPAVDANMKVEADAPLNSINLSQWIDRLEESKAGVRLLLIDACRDNPYSRGFRSSSRGLARIESAPVGTLVHFATRPGGVADDGIGENGLYTSHLLKHLGTPALPVESMLKRVASDVRKASAGLQQPWTEGSLDGEFFIVPAGRTGVAAETASVATASSSYTDSPAGTKSRSESTERDCSECPEVVPIPAGRFMMGSPNFETERRPNEGPFHAVEISRRVFMGRHEVTRAQFAAFVAATGFVTDAEHGQGCTVWTGMKYERQPQADWRNPGFPQDDSHPAVCLSWNDSRAYVTWLNQRLTERNYRLPTEAEWEYAARANQGSARFPWGEDANFVEICRWANGMDQSAKALVPGISWEGAGCSDGHAYTAPADAFRPNAFGLHGLHGNAREWVQDIYVDSYVGAPSDGSARESGGPEDLRALRGGSWSASPWYLGSSDRTGESRSYSDSGTGFRVVRDP